MVTEGPHKGRRLYHDIWLTEASLPQAKRDLGKLGVPVEDFDKMVAWLDSSKLPPGMRCKLKIGCQTDDDGTQRNRVVSFVVIGVDAPPVNHFAPPPEPTAETTAQAPVQEPVPTPEPSTNGTTTDPTPPKKKRGRPRKADLNGVHDGGRF